MKYRFIEGHRHRYGVKVMCDVLQDVPCCRNTVASRCEAQIVPRSVRRFRITTDSRNTQEF